MNPLSRAYSITIAIYSLLTYQGLAVSAETLNISGDTKGICRSVVKQKYEGVLVITFIADPEHDITKIMDSGYTIWDASGSRKRLSLFKVYSLDNLNKLGYMYLHIGIPSRTRYFQKRGYNWFEIQFYDFNLQLARLQVERTLDLNDTLDPSVFITQNHAFFGLPATVIIPRPKFIITRVSDDFHRLWTIQSETERCTSIIIHGKKGKPKQVHLHIKNYQSHDQHFFVKQGDTWVKTSKSRFYYRLDILDKIERSKQIQRAQP